MPTHDRKTVFISSTTEDLSPSDAKFSGRNYREAARDGVLGAGMFPEMMEYWTADGKRPPLKVCLEKVQQADLVVVIVAYTDRAALAAKTVTTTIPIVFLIGSDPIQLGLVASLARPGENITGVSWFR